MLKARKFKLVSISSNGDGDAGGGGDKSWRGSRRGDAKAQAAKAEATPSGSGVEGSDDTPAGKQASVESAASDAEYASGDSF